MASRLDFSRLDPLDFEALCHRIVLLDEPAAKRVAPPDGGCDTLVLAGSETRAWQAKRFSGAIQWKQCEESVQRAHRSFAPATYTFLFARNLTASETQTFAKRLETPWKGQGVKVGFYDADWLESKIRFHSDLKIEEEFFGSGLFGPSADALARSIRAGCPLWGPTAAFDSAEAVAEHLELADPHYRYTMATGRSIGSSPPESVIRFEHEHAFGRLALDAIPKDAQHFASHPPVVRITVDPAKASKQTVQDFTMMLQYGGELELDEGAAIEIDGFPTLMHPPETESEEERVTVRLVPQLQDVKMRIELSGNETEFSLPLDFEQVDPWGEWRVCFRAGLHDDCFEFLLKLSPNVDGAGGAIGFDFSYHERDVDPQSNALALDLVAKFYSATTMDVFDRSDGRHLSRHELTPELDTAEELRFRSRGYGHLARVERQLGRRLPWPIEPTQEQIKQLYLAGEALEKGEFTFTFESLSLERNSGEVGIDESVPHAIVIDEPVGLPVFGQMVPVGRFRLPLGDCWLSVTPTASNLTANSLTVRPHGEEKRSIQAFKIGEFHPPADAGDQI